MNISHIKKVFVLCVSLFFVTSSFETIFKLKRYLYPFGLSFYPYVFTNELFFIDNSVTAQFKDGNSVKLSNEQIFGKYRPISINGDTYYCITRFNLMEEGFCDVVFKKICRKAQIEFPDKILKIAIQLNYKEKKVREYSCEK